MGLVNRPGITATSPEALGELSRIVPMLRNRFRHLTYGSESHGETARIRFTDAFHEMLSSIADEQPVILVIDDLHLADDVSLAVLNLILTRAAGQAIMAILVARPGELHQCPQAQRLRSNAAGLGISEIPVVPLTTEHSWEMLYSFVAQLEQVPTPSQQRAMLRAAAGNPMAIELLVQDWQASGDHSIALSVSAMTPDFNGEGPAQQSYRQILDRITPLTGVYYTERFEFGVFVGSPAKRSLALWTYGYQRRSDDEQHDGVGGAPSFKRWSSGLGIR